MDNGFRPLTLLDGYLPIEDHGLIGDGRAAALVGRDGTVSWLCAPRFDSPPVFCGLLDRERGGGFRVAPVEPAQSRQYYLDDTGVLVTELRTDAGQLTVTDSLTLTEGAELTGAPAGRGELLRALHVPHGEVEVEVAVEPRERARVTGDGAGLRLTSSACPDVTLRLAATAPLDGLRTRWRLAAGDRLYVWLAWRDEPEPQPDPGRRLESTVAGWRRWAAPISYEGPQRALVRRSAITLKLLDYAEDGAIVAAPTSSLPEAIGGERNWDYRYTWVRDAAFSVYALRRVGLPVEAEQFLTWVLDMIDRVGEPRILYDLDGRQPARERIDGQLAGYRDSPPVRWGNAAADQTQHDVYGEILDCAYQRLSGGGGLDESLWEWLRRLAELARARWRRPDQGIWEVRSPARPFTYSVALCHVALDRAARIAQRLDLPGDRQGWAAAAAEIRQAILDQAWDPQVGALTERLGPAGGPAAGPDVPATGRLAGLDASVLALPLRRVLPSSHPAMVGTTRAVADRLGAGGGLLYRYLPQESPDGVPGHEGAFLLCSFWLVDNLTGQGRLDEAGELFESLCARASPLGLLPEQIDPTTGMFLGNFPQALSHVGVISSGLNLARAASRTGSHRAGEAES